MNSRCLKNHLLKLKNFQEFFKRHDTLLMYAVPFFFIKKKDGKLQPVQDYQHLNEWTICNHYPLPLIPQLINRVRMKKLFTKFDVC